MEQGSDLTCYAKDVSFKKAFMNKPLLTILMFMGLLLFLTSPFALLAGVMLVLLVGALFWTIVSIMQVIMGGNPNNPPSKVER